MLYTRGILSAMAPCVLQGQRNDQYDDRNDESEARIILTGSSQSVLLPAALSRSHRVMGWPVVRGPQVICVFVWIIYFFYYYIFLNYTFTSSIWTMFQNFLCVKEGCKLQLAINITQSTNGLLAGVYIFEAQANLICRISAANWPLSVSTRAEICKLFWSAVICLLGGHVSWGYFCRVAKTCRPCRPVGAIFSGQC